MPFLGIGLPGEGAMKAALRDTRALSKTYRDLFANYYPQAMSELWRTYLSPETPVDQAQMHGFEAKTARDTGYAAQGLQQALTQRGLGRSSYGGNALASLWNGYGTTMANARFGQMQDLQARRAQALSAMLGQSAGAGAAAMGGYQQQYTMGDTMAQNSFNNAINLISTANNILGDWIPKKA